MAEQSKQQIDLFNLAAWAYERRKSLIGIAAVVAAVAIIFGLYSWRTNAREEAANVAFNAIKMPVPSTNRSPAEAKPFLKVADDYPASSAAARSLIVAGSILFEAGKYAEAQAAFDKYLASYREFHFTSAALLGVAACLDAQGKTAEAIQRYETVAGRAQDYAMVPAKAALARLYVQQNKPELALRQCVELVQMGLQDSWARDAQNAAQEILAKHPELRQTLQAPAGAPAAQPPAAPRS